jgi:hypothetical protein
MDNPDNPMGPKSKILDPQLAARIAELRLPDWPALSVEQEQQRVYAVENLAFFMKSALVAVTVVAVAWVLFSGPLTEFTGRFRDHAYLRDLWPWNWRYLQSLAHSRLSEKEQNFFIAMNSFASATWIICLTAVTVRGVQNKTTFYTRRWLPGALAIVGVMLVIVQLIAFVGRDRMIPPEPSHWK